MDDTLCYGDPNTPNTFTITNPNTQRGTWRYDLDVTYPAGVTGSLSDQLNLEDLSITDNLVNTTLNVLEVTYRFTPHINPEDGDGECGLGEDTLIRVWINPQPKIIVAVDDTLCYGDPNTPNTFTITNPNTQRGTWRYDLDVEYPAGVTGSLSDQVNLEDLSLTDNLVNTTLNVLEVTYRFTPHINPEDGDGECGLGVDTLIRVWINPQPKIIVAVDDTLCYGDPNTPNTFTITNPNTQRGTWRYDLDVEYPAGVTGSLSDQVNLEDLSLTDNLVNTTLNVLEVTYRFTPHINPEDGDGECGLGVDTLIRVWINPQPKIIVAVDDTLCYGDPNTPNTFTITNPNTQRGTWRYDLDVEYPAGVTGSLSDQVNLEDLSLTDNLVNTTLNVLEVTYRFTPHINPEDGDGECGLGEDTLIRVWINPQPKIIVAVDDTLCYGDPNTPNTFTITNPNTQRGAWRYDLDVKYPAGVTGELERSLNLEDLTLTDNLVNTTLNVLEVTYRFTPHINPGDGDGECGLGVDTLIRVWINPQPKIVLSYTDSLLCDEDSISFTALTGNGAVLGDWVYDITFEASDISALTGVNGAVDTAANSFTQFLRNNTDTLQWVDYTFSPKIKNVSPLKDYCNNGVEKTVRVWINPIPHLKVIAEDTIYCDTSTVRIDIENINGTVYGNKRFDILVDYIPGAVCSSYVPADTDIDNPVVILDDLVNNTDSLQIIKYIFIPKIFNPAGNDPTKYCDSNGIIDTITIYLNPTPRINLVLSTDTVVCDTSDYAISLTKGNPSYIGDARYIIHSEYTGNPGDVSGVFADGEYDLDDILSSTLINNTKHLRGNYLQYKTGVQECEWTRSRLR